MYDIQIFNNPDFGDIRTVTIDGEPWFVAKDIAEKLGYTRTSSMTKQIDDEDKRIFDCASQAHTNFNTKTRNIGIINESGLYSAIMGSQLKNAKAFKRWVTKDILPSVRRTGTYGKPKLPTEPMELLELHYQALKKVDGRVDRAEERIDALDKKLHEELMNLPLLGLESETVDKALKRRGVEIAGGKESNAYKDKRLLRRIYWDLHGQLRREFGVSTYRAIKRNQTDLALKFLTEYKPPLFLAEQIASANAQQTLDLEGGAGNV